MTTKRTEPKCRRCGQPGHNKAQCAAAVLTPQVVPGSRPWPASPTCHKPLPRDPEALEAVAVMLGQLLDAVVLVKTLGALPRECIAAVFDHGYELHRWRAGHLPDSAVRAAHYSMWRMIEVTKDRAWLESAALGMLDRETLSSLLWMAFRVSGYITVRNSGTDAPVWVRMYHASILARFGVAAAQVRQVEP